MLLRTYHQPHLSLYNLCTRLPVFFLDSWPLKMGPRGCPKTLVRNYHYLLHNSPEDSNSHLFCNRSLKSWTIQYEAETEGRTLRGHADSWKQSLLAWLHTGLLFCSGGAGIDLTWVSISMEQEHVNLLITVVCIIVYWSFLIFFLLHRLLFFKQGIKQVTCDILLAFNNCLSSAIASKKYVVIALHIRILIYILHLLVCNLVVLEVIPTRYKNRPLSLFTSKYSKYFPIIVMQPCSPGPCTYKTHKTSHHNLTSGYPYITAQPLVYNLTILQDVPTSYTK